MNKYKVGDKIVLTVSDVNEKAYYSYYMFNNNNLILWEPSTDKYAEQLSNYTETLEAKIRRQAAEITRLLAEKKKKKNKEQELTRERNQLMGRCGGLSAARIKKFNDGRLAGQNEAWELARKITVIPKDGGYGGSKLIEIFNTALNNEIFNLTYPEAAAKVAEWEKAKEEIKVGDVYMSQVGNYFVIYDIDQEKGIAKILWSDLSNSARELDDIKEYYIKTGRHIDIDSFLKQIGEE